MKKELLMFLREYRHRSDIEKWLSRNTPLTDTTSLTVRKLITRYNKELHAEGSPLRIVRTKKGYHLTDDPEELKEYASFYKKQAVSMFKTYNETMKFLGLQGQTSLFEE